MNTNACIFCRIIAGQLPATIIAQDKHAIIIKDINPSADIHWLIIPRKHFPDMRALDESDKEFLGSLMFLGITTIRDQAHNAPFRTVVNNGAEVGQHVFHSHIHLLSGNIRMGNVHAQ